MPYMVKEDLRKPPFSVPEQDLDNTQAEILLELARQTIERLCGQSFVANGTPEAPVEELVNGTGHETIFVPKRLVQLIKIRMYGSETSYADYPADKFIAKEWYVNFKAMASGARSLSEGFNMGSANVGVFGIWGWKDTPAMIRYAQGKLVRKMALDGEMAVRKSQESIGDYSFTVKDNVSQGVDYSITGDAEIDLILSNYKVHRFDVPV